MPEAGQGEWAVVQGRGWLAALLQKGAGVGAVEVVGGVGPGVARGKRARGSDRS